MLLLLGATATAPTDVDAVGGRLARDVVVRWFPQAAAAYARVDGVEMLSRRHGAHGDRCHPRTGAKRADVPHVEGVEHRGDRHVGEWALPRHRRLGGSENRQQGSASGVASWVIVTLAGGSPSRPSQSRGLPWPGDAGWQISTTPMFPDAARARGDGHRKASLPVSDSALASSTPTSCGCSNAQNSL